MPQGRTDLTHERGLVASASRRLAGAGLVRGTGGNVSLRVGDRVVITPTGCELASVQAEQVTVVDRDGRVVIDDALAPTSELDLHLAVHARQIELDTGACAVVHTHAPVATAVGCVVDELPCVHYEMLALGGTVRVAPYATFGTPALAASVVEALEGRRAALLSNHGTVAVGDDLDGAVAATELLEWASEVFWRARQIGEPRVLDEEARGAVVEAALARGYGRTRAA